MGAVSDRAWWRWLAAPWGDVALAAALIGAAAAPVMLVGSADVWRAASRDDVAARAVADAPADRNGLDVLLESSLDAASAARADEEIVAAMGAVDGLTRPRRSVYTLPGIVTLGPPPLRTVGPSGQLFAQDGSLDAVDVVDQLSDTRGGVWVTTWFAERHELSLGDPIAFEAGAIVDEQWNDLVRGGGANAVFRVVGFYEPLWSEDGDAILDPYWSTVPPEVIPTFVPAFASPNTELVLAEESTILGSSLTGVLRWRASLPDLPARFDPLVARERQFRRFETALVGAGPLGRAMADAATVAGRRPVLSTDFFETSGSARRAARLLDGPLAAARGVGGVVGLAAAAAVGLFLVERRRSEFRLLAAEGDGSIRIGARVAAQLVLPFGAGALVGIAGALAGPSWFGPADHFDPPALGWSAMAVAWAVSIVLASAVAGVLGARTLRPTDHLVRAAVARVAWAALVIGAIASWVQVGRTTAADAGRLDLVVVALPVVSILLVTMLALEVTGRLLGWSPVRSDGLPVEFHLALRRLSRGSGGVRIAAAALGLGIGLLVFGTALTSSLDRTVDVKLATEIGGVTSVELVDDLPDGFEAPAATTVVRTSDTSLTPGDVPTRIVAIDPATYADAVMWPDQFGADIDAIVAAVSTPVEDGVPVVGVTGEPSPVAGAFGITRAFQYRMVDRIDAFPSAGNRLTSLLASADEIDRFAAGARGYPSIEAAVADGFALPVAAYRRLLITQARPDEITRALDDAGVRYRAVTSQRDRRQEPSVVATRAAFDYLGVIGIVALVGALVSLALFLAARRRSAALTQVMTRSMGLSPARSASVSVVELATVLAIAVAASFAAVPPVVRRLSPRFDPAPERPPDVPVVVSWPPLIGIAVAGTALVCAAVWWVEWRGGRRPAGELVRSGG